MKPDIPAELAELFSRAEKLLPSDFSDPGIDEDPHLHALRRDIKVLHIALGLQRNQLRVRELELHTTNQLIETFQDITHVGIVELDVATRKLRWSMETYRIHDTSPEEF